MNSIIFIRFWQIWLYETKRTRKSSTKNAKTNEQYYFITSNALLSIELNVHYLIYLYLLIEQKLVPKSTANWMHLLSSQPCENVFRDARALSGIYSARINSTMRQFLQRINKPHALMELRQFESTNIHEKIMFPVEHKMKQLTNEIDFNDTDEDDDFNCNNVEEIIGQAYEAAQQMAIFAGMGKDLIKFNLFNMEESAKMAEKLLKLNTLTETEMIILGDRNGEDSDEDVFDRVEDDEEEDFILQESKRKKLKLCSC